MTRSKGPSLESNQGGCDYEACTVTTRLPKHSRNDILRFFIKVIDLLYVLFQAEDFLYIVNIFYVYYSYSLQIVAFKLDKPHSTKPANCITMFLK